MFVTNLLQKICTWNIDLIKGNFNIKRLKILAPAREGPELKSTFYVNAFLSDDLRHHKNCDKFFDQISNHHLF